MESADSNGIIMEEVSPLADAGFSFWRPRSSSAEGASYRGAASAEGVWFGEGVPLPNGDGSVDGAVPPPQKSFGFLPRNGAFCVHSDT